MRVGDLVNNPNSGARDIADVMRQDPSLTAKVLRLVNSSYYSIPGGVTDVARAISFIGFNTLHQLVLSVSVFQALKTPSGALLDGRGLWSHSLATAVFAEVLAARIGYRDAATCFTAGLLHDIGKMALAITEPTRFGQAVELSRKENQRMNVSEVAVGLPTHERVGMRLARKWKFPVSLHTAIERHHDASDPKVRSDLAAPLLQMLDIVSLANDLSHRFRLGDSGTPLNDYVTEEQFARLGLSIRNLDDIQIRMEYKLERSQIFMDLIQGRDSGNTDEFAKGATTTKVARPQDGS